MAEKELDPMTIDLTDRETAILGALLSRSEGWDTPRELERFVNVAAEAVPDGWTDEEVTRLHEKIAAAYLRSPIKSAHSTR